MGRKAPNLPEGDDGRTIASMNVEGMPWYRPTEETGVYHETETNNSYTGDHPYGTGNSADYLTDEEVRFATWGAVKAALLVVGFICLGIVLFILFCTTIWFA